MQMAQGLPLNPHLQEYYRRVIAARRDIGAVVASLVAQGAGGATSEIIEVARWGFYQETLGGAVYWDSVTGAQFVDKRILDKYRQLGAELSFLGYPIAHNAFAADGVGMFSRFQHGVIHWHPATGAVESLPTNYNCGNPTGPMSSIEIQTYGSPGGKWSKRTLTFSIDPSQAILSRIFSLNDVINQIVAAFAQWRAASNFILNFTRVAAGGDIRL